MKKLVYLYPVGEMRCALYHEKLFDKSTATIIPHKKELLPAIYLFTKSSVFKKEIKIRQ